MHWRRAVSKDSPYLHYWDIMEMSPIKVTTTKWDYQIVKGRDGKQKELCFIHFKELTKPLGLCVTNGYILSMWFGEDIDQWMGKQITLRHAQCRGTDCIRIQQPDGAKIPDDANLPKFTWMDGKRNPDPRITPDQLGEIDKLMAQTGTEYKSFCAYLRVSDLSELVQSKYQAAINALINKGEKQHDTNQS